jgi:tripartite-type tricarboxylate transporter receptor subunit TctC
MKFITIIVSVCLCLVANAAEIITIKSPYAANHIGHVAIYRLIEKANQSQNTYRLMLELKPGDQGVVALKSMDQSFNNSLSVIHAAYVENSMSGKIIESDYVPISSLGNACWLLISKIGNETEGLASLAKYSGEVVIGAPGIGSATHLTVIEISEKIKKPIQYVSFKSAAEANLLMVGNNEINFGIASYRELQNLQLSNPTIKPLATHCPHRHSELQNVRTTSEQRIDAPYVFNTIVANKNMPASKRAELATLIDTSLKEVGEETVFQLSDFSPPIFRNQDIVQFHNLQINILKKMLAKHKSVIQSYK